MLCPQFFDIKPLGEIAPVTAGVAINDRINRGMVMLHELMHAFDKGIRGECPRKLPPKHPAIASAWEEGNPRSGRQTN